MRFIVLPALWFIGVLAIAWTARWSDATEYPVANVLTFLLSMTAVLAILLAVLQPGSYVRSWGRALTACLVSACFAFVSGFWAFHGEPPTYVYLFVLWMQALPVGLGGLFIWSALASLPLREGPKDAAEQPRR